MLFLQCCCNRLHNCILVMRWGCCTIILQAIRSRAEVMGGSAPVMSQHVAQGPNASVGCWQVAAVMAEASRADYDKHTFSLLGEYSARPSNTVRFSKGLLLGRCLLDYGSTCANPSLHLA